MLKAGSLVRVLVVAVLAAVLLLATAGVASASVAEPTLGLEALRAKLSAAPAHALTGYLKTVVRGATIETIPVEVRGLTASGSDALIMFEAQGDKIASYGGIVSGMSGSPIYVDDQGVDKVIGALSYGDTFTLGGTGLATPIESMLRLAEDYAPRVQMLSSPVVLSGRTVDRVVIASDPFALAGVRAPGALVARPLTSLFVGGLAPTGHAFSSLAARLESRGLSVIRLGVPLSSGTATFATDFEPGASVAALATRGDLWVGGIGTTTWSDGGTVLAFGHPAFYAGASSLYLCNAWVTGVWPSLAMPSKVGYPTAVRGTITQDRNAGIMGVLGALPEEAVLTAHAVDADTGREASSTTWASSRLLDSGQLGGIPIAAASIAASRLYDANATPGSAATTTTVHVSVGADRYTVVMVDLIDDAFDVPTAIGLDSEYAVSSLLAVLADGVEQPHIVSVDVEASITTHRAAARIAGVSLAAPLHVGDNRVSVSLLAYGVATTRTVDTTLSVPAGTPLTGTVVAVGARGAETGDAEDPAPPAARDTVAGIVTRLETQAPGNSFTVKLVPDADATAGDSAGSGETADGPQATETTPWVISGTAQAEVSRLTAEVEPRTVPYGGSAIVRGEVTGPAKAVTVSIWGTASGSVTETLLARERATFEDGTLSYAIGLDGLRTTTALRVTIEGGDGYTPAATTTRVAVRARIRLTASAYRVRFGRHITLTASVTPRDACGRVTFQYWDGADRRWRAIGTRAVHTAGSFAVARIDWMPRWGDRKVRAVYGGDLRNARVTSAKITTSAR